MRLGQLALFCSAAWIGNLGCVIPPAGACFEGDASACGTLVARCEEGSADDCRQLARAHWDGLVDSSSRPQAVAFYEKACARGDCREAVSAISNLPASSSTNGTVLHILELACARADADACALRAVALGIDTEAGREALSRACELGHDRACHRQALALLANDEPLKALESASDSCDSKRPLSCLAAGLASVALDGKRSGELAWSLWRKDIAAGDDAGVRLARRAASSNSQVLQSRLFGEGANACATTCLELGRADHCQRALRACEDEARERGTFGEHRSMCRSLFFECVDEAGLHEGRQLACARRCEDANP